jgi:hypothetical protein
MHPRYIFTIKNIDGPTLVPPSFSDVFISLKKLAD